MTPIDKTSTTWKTVAKFMEVEMLRSFEKLLDDADSDKQRGRIELLRELDALANPDEAIHVSTDSYT